MSMLSDEEIRQGALLLCRWRATWTFARNDEERAREAWFTWRDDHCADLLDTWLVKKYGGGEAT